MNSKTSLIKKIVVKYIYKDLKKKNWNCVFEVYFFDNRGRSKAKSAREEARNSPLLENKKRVKKKSKRFKSPGNEKCDKKKKDITKAF